jgi:2-C-methyl-D-erythritol 4-phosphate cytidylyltransferase
MSAMRQVRTLDVGERKAVIVAASTEGSSSGLTVSRADLITLLAGIDGGIDTVVFLDGDRVDQTTIEPIKDMVDALGANDALVSTSGVSDAVKEVRDGVIVRSIDRSDLVYGIPPAVIKRSALEQALNKTDGDLIDPVSVVATSGGSVSRYPRERDH